LITQLSELEITATEDDLAKAKEAFVLRVFEQFVEILMGVSNEDLNQPVFSGLKAIEYTQLHEDSIPRITLFRKL
jgi:hypothetical protein